MNSLFVIVLEAAVRVCLFITLLLLCSVFRTIRQSRKSLERTIETIDSAIEEYHEIYQRIKDEN